jgi:hypothetical protein
MIKMIIILRIKTNQQVYHHSQLMNNKLLFNPKIAWIHKINKIQMSNISNSYKKWDLLEKMLSKL